MAQKQMLRDRARDMRLNELNAKDVARQAKAREVQSASRSVRQESARLTCALQEVHTQTLEGNTLRVETAAQMHRHHKLRTESEQIKQEQMRELHNAERYAQLQEEIQKTALAISLAERDETRAVDRLQNSRCIYSEVVEQLDDIAKPQGLTALPPPSSRLSPQSATRHVRSSSAALSPRPGSERTPRVSTASSTAKAIRSSTASSSKSSTPIDKGRCRTPRGPNGLERRLSGGSRPEAIASRNSEGGAFRSPRGAARGAPPPQVASSSSSSRQSPERSPRSPGNHLEAYCSSNVSQFSPPPRGSTPLSNLGSSRSLGKIAENAILDPH